MILSAIGEKLKRRSKDDFKGRRFQASLIVQAVSWYLRYPLSYGDIEELFLERGLVVSATFFSATDATPHPYTCAGCSCLVRCRELDDC